MASKPVTLRVQPRGKKIPGLPSETSIYLQGSASELYDRIAKQSRFSVHRLRITNADDGKPVPNDPKASVDSLGLRDGSAIQVKDLGPQVAWKTVFVIEYAGPLLIHPLVYLLRRRIYSYPYADADADAASAANPSTAQTLTCAMVVLHFAKRELETLCVHRFSNATMPAFNILKNSAHYWLLSGVLIAYFTYGPDAPAARPLAAGGGGNGGNSAVGNLLTYAALALFAASELANLNAHLVLRSLRSPGGTERGVPRGLGFDWVTCPNYLFETLAWLAVLAVNRSWATALFIAVAVAQMAVWARKKEARYRRELGVKYPRKRFAMIPGVF